MNKAIRCRHLGSLAACTATTALGSGPVFIGMAAQGRMLNGMQQQQQVQRLSSSSVVTTDGAGGTQEKIKAARKMLKDKNAGKVLMPDGTYVNPEDVDYVDADVSGTAMDGANDYGRAQRSKAVSYTWGALAFCMGLFMIAANKIKEEREAARQQQIVEAAEQTK